MKRAAIFILAFFAFSSILFADAAGARAARMKTDALDVAIKPYLKGGEIATYDNFISRTGTEYVVISLNLAPSFLAALSHENGIYKVDFIRDNSTIRQIMEGRFAVFNFSYAKVDPKGELHPLFAEFANARFLQEEKCKLVLGISGGEGGCEETCRKPAGGGCEGEAECKAACGKSPVCSKYLEAGQVSPGEIAVFSAQAKAMDGLLAGEETLSGAGAVQDSDYAKKYMEVVEGIERAVSAVSSLALASSGVACQPVKYDLSPIGRAREKISLMLSGAQMIEGKNAAILGVQKATHERLPKGEKTVEVREGELAKEAATSREVGRAVPGAANAQGEAAATKVEAGKVADGGAGNGLAPSQNAMVANTDAWLLDLGRGAMIAMIGALAIASGYFYYKKRKGQLGRGLRL